MDTSYPSRDKVAYFICLTAKEDVRPFGSTRGRETLLNERGQALKDCWEELSGLGRGLTPDALVIGSRQVQGILMISSEIENAPSLAEALKLFKVLAALRLSQLGGKANAGLWKKGYSERFIASPSELVEARKALGALRARVSG